MVPRQADAAAHRRFVLRGPPVGGRFELAEGEVEHAARVLRLGPGDALTGLDGAGAAWPLVVVRADPRAFEVTADGPPERAPAPGEAGAPLPWIEVAVALPRGERAEALVERLVQLGAAAVRPLLAARASPEARAEGPRRTARLARAARGALAQSGRLWELLLHPAETPAEVLARPALLDLRLDPRAPEDALAALARHDLGGTRERPLRLWVGPEGGFAPEEVARLDAAGAVGLRLGPHVLRIETAAEAGVAIVAAASARRPPAGRAP